MSSHSQLRRARVDTGLHVHTVHSQDDDIANQQVIHGPQNDIQSANSRENDSKYQPLSDPFYQQHTHSNYESIQTTSEEISVASRTGSRFIENPHRVMLRCHDKLVTALSLDPQGIAGVLLAKGLIPENTEAEMRQCTIPREKAVILITTLRNRIEVSPKRFYEFLDILSKQEWSKDIIEVLQLCNSPE